jgi:RimJ/RimL family protein N-acetyltransferase
MAQHLHSRPRHTPRFIVRPFRRRDVGPMHDAVQASLPELEEWLPWAIGYDRSVAHRFIRDSASAWNDARAFDFAIRLPDEPDFHVGNISVWPTSPANRVGEIGYWVRSDLTGEGIGTEVTARTIQVGFEELDYHKIVLRIAIGNERSDRIAKRLGFTLEGTLRDEVKLGTNWLDHTSWSLLEEEWPTVRDELVAAGVLQ